MVRRGTNEEKRLTRDPERKKKRRGLMDFVPAPAMDFAHCAHGKKYFS
jgi:hypothetical protein